MVCMGAEKIVKCILYFYFVAVEFRLEMGLVDDAGKVGDTTAKGDHRMVPYAGVVLNALLRRREEDCQSAQVWAVICVMETAQVSTSEHSFGDKGQKGRGRTLTVRSDDDEVTVLLRL